MMGSSSKKCLIVVNAYETLPSVAHFLQRMKDEFSRFQIETDVRPASEIFAYVGQDGSLKHEDLPYDFALFLDKDRYIASMLEMAGLRLFNKAKAIELCDDKMLTYLSLANAGIHMPKTVSAPLHYSLKNSDEFLNNLAKTLSFPIVAKGNFGSMGCNVFLVKNEKELAEIEAKLTREPRLYQEAISASFGMDHRLIVIGGKTVCGYCRKSENGDFRSNIAVGGHGVPIQLSEKEKAMAEKAASILGLDYCGVDILIDEKGEPVLCEVNSNAFIEGAEKVTGVNIAGAYASYIHGVIYEKA